MAKYIVQVRGRFLVGLTSGANAMRLSDEYPEAAIYIREKEAVFIAQTISMLRGEPTAVYSDYGFETEQKVFDSETWVLEVVAPKKERKQREKKVYIVGYLEHGWQQRGSESRAIEETSKRRAVQTATRLRKTNNVVYVSITAPDGYCEAVIWERQLGKAWDKTIHADDYENW